MVQNASPTPNRLGRRPGFDSQAVVAAAIVAFWSKGFEATTLSDLEKATGIDRSSIYNSFGGKEGLYRSATAAYVDRAEEVLFRPLHKGTEGVADIVEFLDLLAENLGAGTNPQGCLIVNDMAAGPDRAATDRYLRSLRKGLRAALERASALGEIDPDTVRQREQLVSAAVIGINLVSRSAADNSAALTLIDGVRSEVNSWKRRAAPGTRTPVQP